MSGVMLYHVSQCKGREITAKHRGLCGGVAVHHCCNNTTVSARVCFQRPRQRHPTSCSPDQGAFKNTNCVENLTTLKSSLPLQR